MSNPTSDVRRGKKRERIPIIETTASYAANIVPFTQAPAAGLGQVGYPFTAGSWLRADPATLTPTRVRL